MKHYTPEDIATVLLKHLPKKINSLLEPACGDGALLFPLLDKKQNIDRITCVDVDHNALEILRDRISTNSKCNGIDFNAVNADFLVWSKGIDSGGFDCVVMNPPYEGRVENWVKVRVGDGVKLVPTEVAFVVEGIRLLNENGRMLAILPGSIVSSHKMTWLRMVMLEMGNLRYIHELPKFTFRGVESRTYAVVFEKTKKYSSTIKLCNRELSCPESVLVKRTQLSDDLRFDFGYYKQRGKISDFYNQRGGSVVELGELVDIQRGSKNNSSNIGRLIHTTHFVDGVWNGDFVDANTSPGYTCNADSDLLMKRVGRNASNTLGVPTETCNGKEISDCVFLLRPKSEIKRADILLMYKELCKCDGFSRFIERGTGATYINKKDLEKLRLPLIKGLGDN